MKLVHLTAAVVRHGHRHSSRHALPLDPYSAWMIRQQNPAMHR